MATLVCVGDFINEDSAGFARSYLGELSSFVFPSHGNVAHSMDDPAPKKFCLQVPLHEEKEARRRLAMMPKFHERLDC